eukprot:31280-Pelagococcus_subviridis.AAC.6
MITVQQKRISKGINSSAPAIPPSYRPHAQPERRLQHLVRHEANRILRDDFQRVRRPPSEKPFHPLLPRDRHQRVAHPVVRLPFHLHPPSDGIERITHRRAERPGRAADEEVTDRVLLSVGAVVRLLRDVVGRKVDRRVRRDPRERGDEPFI